MKIYNETKTEILENVDLEKGYLKEDKLVIRVVPAQEEVQEQFHYEFKDYTNDKGEVYGRDRIKVVDVPYQPAVEAYDEYEDILVAIPYTQEELDEVRLKELINWFETYFRMQLEQHSWQKDYTPSADIYFKNEDGTFKTYETFEDIIAQAEIVREEIKQLRNK